MDAQNEKTLQSYNDYEIKLYEYFAPTAKKDAKKLTLFEMAQKMIRLTKNKEGKKLAKVLADEDYVSYATDVSKLLEAVGSSGPVMVARPDDPKNPLVNLTYIQPKGIASFKVLTGARDLSKMEHRNSFMVTINGSLLNPSVKKIIDAVLTKVRSLLEAFNKLHKSAQQDSFFSLGFNEFYDKEGNFTLYMGMKKEKDASSNKWISTGFPSLKVEDETKCKMAVLNGVTKYIPVQFPKAQTHEKELHKLFGAGTEIRCDFLFVWSISKGKLNLKLTATTRLGLISVPNTTEHNTQNRFDSAFDKPEGFVIVEGDMEEVQDALTPEQQALLGQLGQ